MPAALLNGVNGFAHSPTVDILSMAVNYPKNRVYPQEFNEFRKRHYPDTDVMLKLVALYGKAGIESHPSVLSLDAPVINGSKAPSINDLDSIFRDIGVRLSVEACEAAIEKWGGNAKDITHVFSATCTQTGNPAFDADVVRQLGLRPDVERVLVHGTGCSGGLTAFRTAFNVLEAETLRHRLARALLLVTELPTTLIRSSLDDVTPGEGLNIGSALFSDCSTAYIISNGLEHCEFEKPIYQVLAFKNVLLPGTDEDITFNVDVTVFEDFIRHMPNPPNNGEPDPRHFDWALHPGGMAVIEAVRQSLGLDQGQLRASYDIYSKNGNSSGTAVLNVINRLQQMGEGRKDVIACAMGPGINVEMSYLRKVESAY